MVRYLKRLKSYRLGRVQALPMYGSLGMSAPSLHRESTDSLIHTPLLLVYTVRGITTGNFFSSYIPDVAFPASDSVLKDSPR